MRYFLIAFLFFYPLLSASQLIPAHMEEEEELVEVSRSSAAYVTSVKSGGHGSGTYVKIGKDYFIITAKHVTTRHKEYFVSVGKKTGIAKKIYESKDKDISVLKINKLKGVAAAEIGRASDCDLKPGKTVVFSGYPSSYSLMTTRAFISGKERKTRYLQGLAWFGSSGSGIFGKNKKLCGVLTAIAIERKGFNTHALETLNYVHIIEESDIKKIKEITARSNEG